MSRFGPARREPRARALSVAMSMPSALLVSGLLSCSSGGVDDGVLTPGSRPNILLLVADDLGFADVGSYGGDIATPNIDALAERGVRFSQFHTAPSCAPTRAMLLSGNDNRVAGMGIQGTPPPQFAGLPEYARHLSDRVVPFPKLLQDAGYHTYIAGKWHLGRTPENSPTAAGFERAFTLMQGAGDHFGTIALDPTDSVSSYWHDGKYGAWPEGAYSTELYTDRLLSFIEDGSADGRPFFAFAAFTSPHWPLQVPLEYRDRYRGRYDMGYDRLREMRFESLKAAGLIEADHTLPPRSDLITPWQDLSPERQREESRKMELYAAMVDNLDFHIGRIMSALEEWNLLENTLIVFMSDNGAAGNDFYNVGGYVDWLRRQYENREETLGGPTSFVSYGPQWAEAGSAPYRGHKGQATEGGIVTPLIVAGPGVDRAGSIERAYIAVSDLAPTFLDLAGGSYPGARGTAGTRPMTGSSMLPLLRRERDRVHAETEVLALSHGAHAFLRIGDWKLVTDTQYEDPAYFSLHDLSTDPGETVDVSARYPVRRAELVDSMDAFRARVGVALPDGSGGSWR